MKKTRIEPSAGQRQVQSGFSSFDPNAAIAGLVGGEAGGRPRDIFSQAVSAATPSQNVLDVLASRLSPGFMDISQNPALQAANQAAIAGGQRLFSQIAPEIQ